MHLARTEHIRQADARMADRYAYPTLLLMEAAGRGIASRLLKQYADATHYCILCGTGNNGGDGLVAARYLHRGGKNVWVLLVGEPEKLTPDAAVQWRIVNQLGVRCTVFTPDQTDAFATASAYDNTVLLDALVGVGFTPPLREPAAALVERLRLLAPRTVAIDMPSGLEAHTGRVLSTPIVAERTYSLQLPKLCHYVTPAANFCGTVEVLDVGVYPEVLNELSLTDTLVDAPLVRTAQHPRAPDAHKGTYGHVLVAGGSLGKAGAIALSAQATLEVGAGLCTAFIPASILLALQATFPPVMCIAAGNEHQPHLTGDFAALFIEALAGKAAVAIGPGLANVPDTADFLRAVLPVISKAQLPLVLDADALNILADDDSLWQYLGAHTVLTPHPGEMARLVKSSSTSVQQGRLEAATALASQRGVTVVLKGAGTITALADGRTYVNSTGNPGMATGGSGDVLTGIIGGLLAQGHAPAQAAWLGVYIHGRAGDRVAARIGHEGVTATRILRAVARAASAPY